MNLPDIKQLKDLLKLLRSQGVLQYQSPELNLVLSELPPQTLSRKSQAEEVLGDLDEDPSLEIERLIDYSSKSPVDDV